MHDLGPVFFEGFWRMDWGLGNPNKTAALIATLMIAVWGLALIRRIGFWLALVPFTGLAICLVHTYSRGGMLAFILGAIPLVIFAPRPWSKVRVGALVVSIWIAIGAVVYLQAHERYSRGLVDRDESILNRLELWSAAPAMIAAAPEGWGHGTAGHSYMSWFQPEDRREGYRTMVNSHLTWLVEFGWPFRIFYVLAWAGVLLICLPSRGQPWLAIPFGVWIAFGVAALFSSVAESPWLWIVPTAAFAAAVVGRIGRRAWPTRSASLAFGAGAGAALLMLAATLFLPTDIRKIGEAVHVGAGKPDWWVVADPAVLGNTYGKTFRKYRSANRDVSVAIVENPSALPDLSGASLLVSGEVADVGLLGKRMAEASLVRVASPKFLPQECGLPEGGSEHIEVFVGEFSASSAAAFWEGATRVRRLTGVGDFIPAWPQKLIETHN